MRLAISALVKFIFGIVLIGALLFLPAWTFLYPNAYLFMALLFIPMLIMGSHWGLEHVRFKSANICISI